jgi:hypothetical protein
VGRDVHLDPERAELRFSPSLFHSLICSLRSLFLPSLCIAASASRAESEEGTTVEYLRFVFFCGLVFLVSTLPRSV